MCSINKKTSQYNAQDDKRDSVPIDRLLLIDKPKGITSFDVVRMLRKKLGVKKIGHAGTLDPFATGLLLVGIGDGTKRLAQLIGLPKIYEADIIFGIGTDTGDMEGNVISRRPASGLTRERLIETLVEMTGVLHLPVPAYSAVKRGGEPLYKKARRGEKVALPIKPMDVYSFELICLYAMGKHTIAKLHMKVGSGAYVRSIAEEIGRRLGVPAVVKELRRTHIGNFRVADAKQLTDI
ncbi:MAG: tRNA pseudouridine(55) synthase TruB [Candidatus Lloydbacteria bacterium CG22_combo_CG10-13_8_21_14_all_47_15]|uniref:tRNA pseudouridine synthase B n=1 Tax=Candidatus Lloydbacteria bacterium CG22_combo_CG10-13_8_21_14_all_47_15 TaxID=1974635 RepID=A0A2H0CTK5_9BACT|nr:MAG: tRNA pseudouridine(55) synthase TruB [Candidatus Lloydbacteria bacterium CG22_combo_CG10-13_8_21_14_all_47_15]